MADGYETDPSALRAASRQIAESTGPAQGIDLPGVRGSQEQYGHGDLYGALSGFCATWQTAIGHLGQRAHAAGEQLDTVAQRYENREASAAGSLGRVGSVLAGGGGGGSW